MTKEEQELLKLLNDRKWRLNNLYKIEDKHGKKCLFRFNRAQEDFYRDLWWLNVILKSRQHGMSTLCQMMQLDECLFNTNRTCGIVDKTEDDAKKKLKKIKFAYEHLSEDGPTKQLGEMIQKQVKITKSNETEIEFSNGSKIWAGVSLRGGTVQFLHISELGPIAYKDPKRAEEIRGGALNTVHPRNKIVIESTHEGGRSGLNYEMIQVAQKNNGVPNDEMSVLDWRFHFFSWFQDKDNATELPKRGLSLNGELISYFGDLAKNHGIKLTDEQKFWYSKKKETQKDAMFKEHPSTAEEAINSVIRGSIYGGLISDLRKRGRICDFTITDDSPFITAWDLGDSDFTSITLILLDGPDFKVCDNYTMNGVVPKHYADIIDGWDRKYGRIGGNFLPHDANNTKAGITWKTQLEEAGLQNIKVVPRTPDIWIGINHLRSLLPRCWVHSTNCSVEREVDGKIIPSLIGALESYHVKQMESGGRIMETPMHDENSHLVDSVRTFAEAHKRGMLMGTSSFARESRKPKPRVRTGIRGYGHRRKYRVMR